jgi:hypothetical protein
MVNRMVKIEQPEEPLDKQQTEVIPVVKPPTMNSLILERMEYMEGTVSDGLQLSQQLAAIHTNQATIKMQNWMNMILSGLVLVGVVVIIVMLSLVFGRMLP